VAKATPRYRAALVDLDDTLFDHQAHRREALTELRESMASLSRVTLADLEHSHEEHLQRTHIAILDGRLALPQARLERMRAVLADFGVQASDAELADCERAYRRGYDREWRAVPGARELLQALRGLGVWIGVVTNGLWAEQTNKMRMLALDGAVDELITSERVGHRKPARQFFEHAVARAGAAASECVVIGDLWEIDIQGALGMGMDAIWLNRYGRTGGPAATVVEVSSLLPTHAILRSFLKGAA
jgi:putative hydrolase of the HAD superfamily